MSIYTPIEKSKSNYYEIIINNLRDALVNGQLKYGEKIPSERELADRFNVSRVPVREALKILEYMGMLENIPGDGLYLKNICVGDLIKKLDFAFILKSQTILDLFEARISIESSACFYAAQRRTEEDIAVLKNTIEEMRSAKKLSKGTQSDLEKIRRASHQFHINIIKAAKNSVLTSIYKNLFRLLDISKHYTLNTKTTESNTFDTILAHEAILNKIILSDSEGARDSMTEHLEAAREKLIITLIEDDSDDIFIQ